MTPRPSAAAERAVAACFLIATGGSVAFVVAYVVNAGPQWFGGLLAMAFAGLALGLILWAGHLLPTGTYVEQRPPMAPPRREQTAFLDGLDRGGDRTPGLLRRTLVLAMLALGAAAVVPLRSLFPLRIDPREELRRTPWRDGSRVVTKDGQPVRADDVEVGAFLTVFPEGHTTADDATAVLLRLEPGDLDRASGEPTVGGGLIAFSKLCTHAGCPVGLYEQTTRVLLCPCHQSVFDVLQGARPVSGPAARPLPRLPLSIDGDGDVRAAGDFRGQVGPTFWRSV